MRLADRARSRQPCCRADATDRLRTRNLRVVPRSKMPIRKQVQLGTGLSVYNRQSEKLNGAFGAPTHSGPYWLTRIGSAAPHAIDGECAMLLIRNYICRSISSWMH